MTEPESALELRFDRAAYVGDDGAGAPCAACRGSLGGSYWKWQNHMICGRCRDAIDRKLQASQSWLSFAKTMVLAGAAAIGCGVGYAVLAALTKGTFALATIGIAIVIAWVIRKASGGLGSTIRYQVAAVALTYVAATMGYLPRIWAGLQESAADHAGARRARGASPDVAVAPPATPVARATPSPLQLLTVFGWVVGIMLAAPFLEATEAPIGLLIVGFGLWQAWKLTRGPPPSIEGPFRIEAAPVPTEAS
ncbi:MAG TPA: hypothetical protein VGM06_03015 [Polyangiaceae bacterium]